MNAGFPQAQNHGALGGRSQVEKDHAQTTS
jgi:hypothetical protein